MTHRIRETIHTNRKLLAIFLAVIIVSVSTGYVFSKFQVPSVQAAAVHNPMEPVENLQLLLKPTTGVTFETEIVALSLMSSDLIPLTLTPHPQHNVLVNRLDGILRNNGLTPTGNPMCNKTNFDHPSADPTVGYVCWQNYTARNTRGGLSVAWSGLVGDLLLGDDPLVGGAFIETSRQGVTEQITYYQDAVIGGMLVGSSNDPMIIKPPFHPNWWYTVYLWWWKWYWYWDWGWWWWWDWWWQWYYWEFWWFWSAEPIWG